MILHCGYQSEITHSEVFVDEGREVEMEELLGRVTALTKELLDESQPPAVVFALATTAADMGLSVTESPMTVFSLLLKAIAFQADRRMEEEAEVEDLVEDDAASDFGSKAIESSATFTSRSPSLISTR